MSFAADVAKHQKTLARMRFLPRNVTAHVHRSIVEGSEVTGAPGQPVDTGRLKTSWKLRYTAGVGQSTTDVPYAPIIEDNERGATLRSSVGGFHSVKITQAGYERIVAHEAEILQQGGGPEGEIPRNVLGQFAEVGPAAGVNVAMTGSF